MKTIFSELAERQTVRVNKINSRVSVRVRAWKSGEPPKGRAIVAVGRIIQHDEISTYADPFVAAIVWMKDQSGYEGWHYCHSVLTVARALEDEVMVDWWNEIPTTANS